MQANPNTFEQLELLPAADPPEAPQQAQKRCIGLIVDSNNIVVQCPELVPPSRNNQRKYHFRTCKYRTHRLRKRGFSAGDKLLLPPKRCTGWALQDGLIVVCGKLFTPSRGNQKYHSAECYVWTWNRRLNGVVLGDTYVKGGHTQQHPPKSCKGWTIRDGVIAKCAEPFTGSGNKEYHSTACLFRTRRWCLLGYHLNDSVRRTCAYRNCHKGEGGARNTFDRIHRSLRSGDYFCDQRCSAAEQRARQADKVAADRAKLADVERILALGLQKNRKKPEAEKHPVQVADAVDAVIPRFAKLIPLRRKQTRELIALGLSSNEAEALRMPGSRTAKTAARYFISLETGLPIDTVAQYHKPSRRARIDPV